MGMDLHPVNPDAKAPRDEAGNPRALMFNLSGWATLRSWLYAMGVDVSEFASYNDEGTIISNETCQRVADLMEASLDKVDENNRSWLEQQIPFWRHCGGFTQW